MILKEAKKGVVNMRSVMEYAEKQGEERGELKQAMKTAREMIRAGEPVEKIKRYTDLTTDKIEELQKTIKQ